MRTKSPTAYMLLVLMLSGCDAGSSTPAATAKRLRALAVHQWAYSPDELKRLRLAAQLAERGELHEQLILVRSWLLVRDAKSSRNTLQVYAVGDPCDVTGLRLAFQPAEETTAKYLDVPISARVAPPSVEDEAGEFWLIFLVTMDGSGSLQLKAAPPADGPPNARVIELPIDAEHVPGTVRAQLFTRNGFYSQEARVRIVDPHALVAEEQRRWMQPIGAEQ